MPGWSPADRAIPESTGGACLSCRPPPLPLALPFAPIPPTPFPAGRGRFFSFLMHGAPPLASPGLDGTRHWLDLRLAVPGGGACPICRLSPLPLALPFAPIPPPPFPSGEGGDFLVFLCKGLRPLHPRGWMGRVTGSTCVWRFPAGGLALFAACRPCL